jgi:hypothetical protein
LKDAEDSAANAEELAKQEAAEKARLEEQRRELIDVDGFGADMKPLGRERMYVTLDAKVRYRGQVMSRKAMIRLLVNEGRRVETNGSGARILAEQGEAALSTMKDADQDRHGLRELSGQKSWMPRPHKPRWMPATAHSGTACACAPFHWYRARRLQIDHASACRRRALR